MATMLSRSSTTEKSRKKKSFCVNYFCFGNAESGLWQEQFPVNFSFFIKYCCYYKPFFRSQRKSISGKTVNVIKYFLIAISLNYNGLYLSYVLLSAHNNSNEGYGCFFKILACKLQDVQKQTSSSTSKSAFCFFNWEIFCLTEFRCTSKKVTNITNIGWELHYRKTQ